MYGNNETDASHLFHISVTEPRTRTGLKGPRIAPAIHKQVLPGDESGTSTTEKRARIAEFRRVAGPARRIGRLARRQNLFIGFAGLFRLEPNIGEIPIGRKRPRQQSSLSE